LQMDRLDETRKAIQSLFEQYSNDIFSYAKFSLGDHSEARDVVQEVFLRAFRSWDRFRGNSSAKTWLYSITRHYILDLMRKRRTEREFANRFKPREQMSEIGHAETNIVLQESLQMLKASYRDVFILRHIEEISVRDTARILGWSEGKVRTTDYRAIETIRKLLNLGSYGGEHLDEWRQ
jgi:RNA polymerase sigma-70 factor (ECF subfamily)